MKINNLNNQNDVITWSRLLIVPVFFSTIFPQELLAETVPSFPASTTVDLKKSPSTLSPLESRTNDEKLSDPQALNAIRTLIQGGIPVGQSKTQIMNNVTPISQYAGSPSFKNDLNSNVERV